MKNLFPSYLFDEGEQKKMMDSLHASVANANNDCWTPFKYVNGVITRIFLSSNVSNAPFVVSMDWLPPTLKSVAMQHVLYVRSWQAERLPRDLRFFFTQSDRTIFERPINFAKLPPKMEELVMINASHSGTVVLTSLPERMRIVYILTNKPLEAVIDKQNIADRLECFSCQANENQKTIYDIDGSKVRPRDIKAPSEWKDLLRSEKYKGYLRWTGSSMRSFVRFEGSYMRAGVQAHIMKKQREPEEIL